MEKTITTGEFDDILLNDILYKMQASQLITIPGIYEIVSEYFNNDVIEIWEDGQD